MHIIRTAEALARALDSPLDPELKQLLTSLACRLADYPDFAFEALAEVVIVEAGEALDGACSVTGREILTHDGARFTFLAELITRHRRWFEVTFILSDDGFGLILYVEVADNSDPALMALCARELQQHGSLTS